MPKSPLAALTRKRDRAGGRALLNEVFDHCLVATVSTVVGDEPWSVPMLVARDGNRLLLHGSTGAGALGAISRGANVAVTAFILDGLVIAERQFDHSANYRSAVVRGKCTAIQRSERPEVLDRFTDAIVDGRSRECPQHSEKELAQTLLLELPIADGMWTAKARSGPPGGDAQGWTGVVPVRRHYGEPMSESDRPLPQSVQTLLSQHGAR